MFVPDSELSLLDDSYGEGEAVPAAFVGFDTGEDFENKEDDAVGNKEEEAEP